eukprot:GILI01006431.1.p1 GENE.GILI01006431.1~~GILI01006431.1.p1  ORF type:complete len:281 (+),score=32.87 GILI01006431.1:97-843(+)
MSPPDMNEDEQMAAAIAASMENMTVSEDQKDHAAGSDSASTDDNASNPDTNDASSFQATSTSNDTSSSTAESSSTSKPSYPISESSSSAPEFESNFSQHELEEITSLLSSSANVSRTDCTPLLPSAVKGNLDKLLQSFESSHSVSQPTNDSKEERQRLMSESDFANSLQIGDRFDAQDSKQKWYEAEVVDCDSLSVYVRFFNTDSGRWWKESKFNEWIERSEESRFRPLYTYSANIYGNAKRIIKACT